MKKLLLLLSLLLTGVSGAWADVTVKINDQTDLGGITNQSTSEATATHKYGVFSGSDVANTPYYTTFTTNETAGVAGLTVSTTAKMIKPTYVASAYAGYGHVFAIYPSDDNTNTYTFTITAPSGYYIKSYSFKAISTSSSGTFNISTVVGGTETTVSSSLKEFSATVNATSVAFTVKRNQTGTAKMLCLSQFFVTLSSTVPTYDGSYTALNINNTTGEFAHDACSNTSSTSWYCRWNSTRTPAGLACRCCHSRRY